MISWRRQEFDECALACARDLATPHTRLKELAPRLLQVLPDTIGGCAERLGATRQEVEDTHQFAIDDVCYRDGRLTPAATFESVRDGYLNRPFACRVR